MKNSKSLLFLLILSVTSCTRGQIRENYIDDFDTSSDDKELILSINNQGKSSLYTADLDGRNFKSLIKSEGDTSYSSPRYSLDGNHVLFVKHNVNILRGSTLCLANLNGSNVENLFKANEIITEAIFSANTQEIIFCMAAQYSKHSPIGIKQAHNFDIFSINLADKKVTKLTNFEAYGINNICEAGSDYILFRMEAGENSGIYSFEKKDPLKLKKIVPSNNPRQNESLYRDPVYDKNYSSLVFTAPYELYSMSLNDRVAKLIYDSKGSSEISVVRLFKSQRRVLFKREIEKDVLQSLDLNGGVCKAIRIEIN